MIDICSNLISGCAAAATQCVFDSRLCSSSNYLLTKICTCCFCDSYGDESQQPVENRSGYRLVTSQPSPSQGMTSPPLYGSTEDNSFFKSSTEREGDTDSPDTKVEKKWSAIETLKGRGRFRPG